MNSIGSAFNVKTEGLLSDKMVFFKANKTKMRLFGRAYKESEVLKQGRIFS